MRRVALACRSSVVAIGTSGPTTPRSSSSSAPSASSSVSVTMAPCSDRQMPSSLPAFRAASTIMSRIVSQHSRVSLPEGVALAAPAHTGCQPYFLAASI